jgi:hypothetical protein
MIDGICSPERLATQGFPKARLSESLFARAGIALLECVPFYEQILAQFLIAR